MVTSDYVNWLLHLDLHTQGPENESHFLAESTKINLYNIFICTYTVQKMEATFWRNLIKLEFTSKQIVTIHGSAHIGSRNWKLPFVATYFKQILLFKKWLLQYDLHIKGPKYRSPYHFWIVFEAPSSPSPPQKAQVTSCTQPEVRVLIDWPGSSIEVWRGGICCQDQSAVYSVYCSLLCELYSLYWISF